MRFQLSKALLLAALALVATAADAHAGRFHVYSCRTPAGQVAPTDGWSGTVGAGGAVDDYTTNGCPLQGALTAALGEQTIHLSAIDIATWGFATPSSETIAAATLWRAGSLHGPAGEGSTYQFWFAGSTTSKVFDECIYELGCPGQGEEAQPLAPGNRVVVPIVNLGSHLFMRVSCAAGFREVECKNGFGDPNGYAAAVYLYAADLTLEQNAGPTAAGVSGELSSAATVGGTSDIAFSASDPGAGVYQARFYVDGQLVQATALDENGGRCRDVGQSADGLPAFLYLQPCLVSLSADVGFDTTRVADGSHHLVVQVLDAAGNAAPVLDRAITVANGRAPGAPGTPAAQGPANGSPASAQATMTVGWRGARGVRLSSAYGHAQTVVGRLVAPGGVPIARAQIEVLATPAYTAAATVAVGRPTTASDGSFSLPLRGGVSSRTLRFIYRSHLGDPVPAATRTLTLVVGAGLTLGVAPRTASVGRTIHFSGRLLGGPIPRGGKPLVLEARASGGSWLEFHVARTDSRGRYRASYRFRFPGPIRYQFRVLCEAQSDYPFAAAASNVVVVRER